MTMRRTLTSLTVAGTLAAVLAVAGCGDGSDTTTADPTPDKTGLSPTPGDDGPSEEVSPKAAAATVQVTIKGDSVEPVAKQVDVGVGDTIAVKIDSDRAGELHVHSTPEQSFEFKPGTSSFDITLDKPGTVDIEEHVSDILLVRALVS
jgi:hypothetical protein